MGKLTLQVSYIFRRIKIFDESNIILIMIEISIILIFIPKGAKVSGKF